MDDHDALGGDTRFAGRERHEGPGHMERIKQAVAQAKIQRDRVVALPMDSPGLRLARASAPERHHDSGQAPRQEPREARPRPWLGSPPAQQPRTSRSGTVAMAVGLGSLLVGAAVVFLTLSRQGDLERLDSTLATRSTEARQAPPAASGNAEVLLNGLRQRVAMLEASVPSGEPTTKRQTDELHSRLAELEAQIAALKSAPATAESATPAVSEPPQASGAVPTRAPVPPVPSDPPPPPASAVTAALEPSPAPAAAPEPVPVPKPVAIAEAVPGAAAGGPPVLTDVPNQVAAAPRPASSPVVAPEPLPLPKPVAADTRKQVPVATKPAAKPVAAVPKPPVTATGGTWAVVVQSFGSEIEAEQRRVQVAELGLPVEIRPANVKGKLWYRVLVAGYPTQDAARKVATDLGRQNLGAPWVLSFGMP